MNKKIFWISFTLFALALSACSSTAKTTGTGSKGKTSTTKLSAQTELVLGTINLEETDYVVTAEQATQLLPMFYVLQELNNSSSAAQEEIDGLVDQIQSTLTKDQLQAIDDMSLSMKDVSAFTQGSSKGSSKVSSTTNTGGGEAGGPPPDMGGMPGGQGGMPSTGTTTASNKSDTTQIMVAKTPTVLLDTEIKLLKKKVEYRKPN
jgi:TolA-binding protein